MLVGFLCHLTLPVQSGICKTIVIVMMMIIIRLIIMLLVCNKWITKYTEWFAVICCVQCVLAAIVIVNLKGVFLQALDVRSLYHRRQYFDLVFIVISRLLLVTLIHRCVVVKDCIVTARHKASFASGCKCYGIICLSVRHTPVLCQNVGMQRYVLFTLG